MKAYAFNASLFCEDCGKRLVAAMDAKETQDNGDSDQYPQGPYPHGGGEADTPQHCEACGVFLENPLTPDGDNYVREKANEHDEGDMAWSEIADAADRDGQPTLAEWIRFYYAPGM